MHTALVEEMAAGSPDQTTSPGAVACVTHVGVSHSGNPFVQLTHVHIGPGVDLVTKMSSSVASTAGNDSTCSALASSFSMAVLWKEDRWTSAGIRSREVEDAVP